MGLMNQNLTIVKHLLKQSFRHFLSHDCLRSAAALSFTTLLSIVPIVALLFFSVSQFVNNSENQLTIHNTLLNIFSPSVGQEMQAKLLLLAEQASKLRTFGLSVLVVTVLLGLNTIDLTINNIWNIERCKRTLLKLALYFLVLMFIPILVGISLYISTYFFSALALGTTLESSLLNSILVHAVPITVTWLAFVSIYLWMPNTKVEVKSALIGGAIAALLFECAMILFLLYISYFPSYDLIYGAFAVLPLFCLWIYISWIIVLIGAVITFNLTEYKKNPLTI